MKKLRSKTWLLILVVGFVLLWTLQSEWLGQWMYPIPYKDTIHQKAQDQELDPLLVAAIIRVETNYIAGRESRKGAVGVMQLMPSTAEWAMQQMKLRSHFSLEQLKDEVDPNITIGTWYLKSLINMYDNNIVAAVAAYNAGPGNVNEWLKNGTWDGSLDTAKNSIPFNETRMYVKKVFHYYEKYKNVYT
ncbi:lytic transglycosylase domain-containing protein [Paenibacillus aquistagni]|uniref:lytic transglycosylase domain-containing protein n=1 Tax=Paenibacillus aquistagni TaxID=1852522 RepID=UPI00145A34EF|nr:lytic transglycosylase domain-containing protein [Paenibacillus aquistagni]NMM53708.1 lytic transglycosylase domain-containing protein [Paenibacillus aquistagni]